MKVAALSPPRAAIFSLLVFIRLFDRRLVLLSVFTLLQYLLIIAYLLTTIVARACASRVCAL